MRVGRLSGLPNQFELCSSWCQRKVCLLITHMGVQDDPALAVRTGDASHADGAAADAAGAAPAHLPPPGFQTAAQREHQDEAAALRALHQVNLRQDLGLLLRLWI